MYMNMFRRVSLTGLLIMIMLMKQVPSLVEYLVPYIISRLHLEFSKFAITMFPGSLMTPNKCNQLGNCSEKHEAHKRLRNRINAKLERDESSHYKKKFYQENPSVSMMWYNVNDYLNTSKRSFSNTPNIIIHDNKTHRNVEQDPKERL